MLRILPRLTLVFILVFNISSSPAVAQQFAIRVAASSSDDVQQLNAAGFELLDARVGGRSEGRNTTFWLENNGFVTIAGSTNTGRRLESAGFTVLRQSIYQQKTTTGHQGQSYPMQFGWPRIMDGWPGVYGQCPTITDFTGNGELEIFLSNIAGFAYMWRPNGTFVLGFPVLPFDSGWSTGSSEAAAVGDINGDQLLEAIFGRWTGGLVAYQTNTLQVAGFPIPLGTPWCSNHPALYDLDDDGHDEIVLMAYPDLTTAPATLHIYNDDGSELAGWPQQLPQHSQSSPAIGDIDSDGSMEIVVGSGESVSANIPGRLYAFNSDGTICNGFPIQIGNSVSATPTLYDIDMDGDLDILIRVQPDDKVPVNGIYAYDGSGQRLPGFPAVIPSGGSIGAPAVADVDGDGDPEIAYGTIQAVDSGKVWLWDHNADLLPGFPQPVLATFVEESVVLEDVSGDTLPDIVCGTNGVGSSDPAKVWAFTYQGVVVEGFPITIMDQPTTLENTPTIIDIDGDGDTEIFTANWAGYLYAFDTPGVTAASSWPTYKYNVARTGSKLNSPTGIELDSEPAIDGFQLHQNYPNPFNPSTTLRYTLPAAGDVRLTIYDVLGRQIRILVGGWQLAGTHPVIWDATDSNGQPVTSGVYYSEARFTGKNGIAKQAVIKMMLMR